MQQAPVLGCNVGWSSSLLMSLVMKRLRTWAPELDPFVENACADPNLWF